MEAITPGVDRRLVRGFRTKSGEPVWKKKFNRAKGVINVADPVVDKATGRIFLTSFYDGSYLCKLDTNKMDVDLLWKRKGEARFTRMRCIAL